MADALVPEPACYGLEALGLSEEDVLALQRQGFVSTEDRGGTAYFKLRWRLEGRQKVLALGLDLGFTVRELDGGGMAYGLDFPEGGYILVTDTGGAKLPEDGEPVLVGIYHADTEPEEMTTYGDSEYAIREIKRIVTSIPA
jgi:hypothetical protein